MTTDANGDAADDLSDAALAASLGDFESRHAEVNGVRLHYVTGGEGEPLILVPGWPETWWEYRKVMPALAERYRVIAVDLRGMGGSARPEGGFDKKNMGEDLYALARELGHDRVNLAGHGIGSMVAFAHAANHPEATGRLVMLNTTHIDESYYGFRIMPPPDEAPPHRWWLAFNIVPGFGEKVLAGRYRLMIDYMFELSLTDPDAVTERDRQVYARAYDAPGGIRAAQGWFQTYQQDIADFESYERLTVPVLGLAYGPFHDYMSKALTQAAHDARVLEVKGTRNYLVEEQPEAVVEAVVDFLG